MTNEENMFHIQTAQSHLRYWPECHASFSEDQPDTSVKTTKLKAIMERLLLLYHILYDISVTCTTHYQYDMLPVRHVTSMTRYQYDTLPV